MFSLDTFYTCLVEFLILDLVLTNSCLIFCVSECKYTCHKKCSCKSLSACKGGKHDMNGQVSHRLLYTALIWSAKNFVDIYLTLDFWA